MIPFLFMFYFGIHKVLGISWLLEDLLASQEGLCPMELVTYFMSLYVCAVFIKLMDDLETRLCTESRPSRKKLYWPIGLIPQRAILTSAFGCALHS